MSVRTVYELRTVITVESAGDVVVRSRYDELEYPKAVAEYERSCSRARVIIDTDQTYVTHGGGELKGSVRSVVVELVAAKTDGGWETKSNVVGASKESAGFRFIVENGKKTEEVFEEKAPEVVANMLEGIAS